MSTLTANLNKIYNWLEFINPNPTIYKLNEFNPGLSDQEINQLVKDLPFSLSDEVFELYRWLTDAIA